mgnify:FL=1
MWKLIVFKRDLKVGCILKLGPNNYQGIEMIIVLEIQEIISPKNRLDSFVEIVGLGLNGQVRNLAIYEYVHSVLISTQD